MDHSTQFRTAALRLTATAQELTEEGVGDQAIAEALADILAKGLVGLAGPAEAARIFRRIAGRVELQADPAEMTKC